MKKRSLVILLVAFCLICLTCVLCACGNKESQTQTTPPTAEDTPSSGGDTPSTGGDSTHVHAYGSWSITRSATCSVEGLKTRRCVTCGNVDTETIPKTAHTPVTDDAVEATCTQEGKTQGSHCGVCGTVIVAQTKVDKKEHTIVIDQEIPATCTEPGKTQGSHCDVCKTVLQEQQETRALGHKATQQYGSDENGHWTKCERCDEHLDPQSHVFVKLSDSYDATCQHQGYLHEKCNVCNKEKTETILAGDHRYVDGICAVCRNIDPLAVVLSLHYADNYGTTLSKVTYAAPDNNFTLPDNVKPNLTSTSNYYAYFAGWFYDEYYEQSVPEGATFNEDCDIYCFGVIEEYSKMTYSISSNEVRLTGMNIKNTNIIAVPPRINGYPVTAIGTEAFRDKTQYRAIILNDDLKTIGDKAFYGCNSLLSIAIPDSVTSIGAYAFDDCTGLSEITIPDSVTSIGKYAFNGCSQLRDIKIPNDLQDISESAFSYSGIETIDFPENIKSIGKSAFYGCTNLQTLTIGENVQSIGSSAFSHCTGLQTVTIGNGVQSIGDTAFYGCTGLQTVKWNATKCTVGVYQSTYPYYDYYTIFEGCTQLATVNIGENVQSIPSYAFSGCTGLSEITIPDNVTSIGYRAFSTDLQTVNWNATNCTKVGSGEDDSYICAAGYAFLRTVYIGENVQSIPSYAFYNCRGLKDIYYAGDETQWANIKKGWRWNQYIYEDYDDNHKISYPTINYTMHYNSTGPEDESAASNISALPSDQPVLIACDKLDLWVKQD